MMKGNLCEICYNKDSIEDRNTLDRLADRIRLLLKLNEVSLDLKEKVGIELDKRKNEVVTTITSNSENRKVKVKSSKIEHVDKSITILETTLAELKARNEAEVALLQSKKIILEELRRHKQRLDKLLYLQRINLALNAFKMMKIEPVAPTGLIPKAFNTNGQEQILFKSRKSLEVLNEESIIYSTGCSTILGMPLQNNGIYDGNPVDALSITLHHVAHLVDSVSNALNIPPNHPMSLFQNQECFISPQYQLNKYFSLSPIVQMISERHSHQPFNWLSINDIKQINTKKESTSINTVHDELLSSLNKDISDELDESKPPSIHLNPYFDTAVILLRVNIVSLCCRAGLKIDELWPSSAILLNLFELKLFLERNLEEFNVNDVSIEHEFMGLQLNPWELTTEHQDIFQETSNQYGIKLGKGVFVCKTLEEFEIEKEIVTRSLQYRYGSDRFHDFHTDTIIKTTDDWNNVNESVMDEQYFTISRLNVEENPTNGKHEDLPLESQWNDPLSNKKIRNNSLVDDEWNII